MNNKIFKNLDEQIEILESKGLTINDYEKAKDILFRENYFFISGYRHLFMKSSKLNTEVLEVEGADRKNSVITSYQLGAKTLKRLIKNNKTLYNKD